MGSVEVIVFPRDYEKYRDLLVEDNKVFIQGRTSVEEEKDAKLICREVHGFDEGRKELWIQFPDKEAYDRQREELFAALSDMDGNDAVVIYIASPRMLNRWMPVGISV